jgi:hypothetical protein
VAFETGCSFSACGKRPRRALVNRAVQRLGHAASIPRPKIACPSPEALGPGSRRVPRRRYADPPAAAVYWSCHRLASLALGPFLGNDIKKARSYVHRLGLQSHIDWVDYCKSGKKPNDIPTSAQYVYAEAGWSGWGDWVGTSRRRGGWQPFKKARAFVRGLGLKSHLEWSAYCKSGKKPNDIPAYPREKYLKEGWAGYGDWLGYVRSGRGSEARSKKGTGEAPAPAEASLTISGRA